MTAKRKTPAKQAYPLPEHLPDDVAGVWIETVERGRIAPSVSPALLESYCNLVVRWREAAKTVADEGLVVDGGEKRGAIVHPALAAERQLSAQLKEWSPLVNRPASADRKRGPVYDATKRSIKAAGLDEKPEFEGACLAVATQAWLIDEAQRGGIEELQKAAYVLIPSYVKGCAELQITPASLPPEATKKASNGGKVSKFEEAAARRRARQASSA
ncbi:P27 family phage terminase small subunit [Microbacterium halophytorum]|uniref:P27 family phage terminase small subunit n=1 Tax=Microbacterium halophytorum TaxID=2067568 RepID=UPI000CFD47FD|nr:P27 family phage terminase small subunit [Microbacterium halophytorum]